MRIKYINKETHEVMDDKNYVFHHNEILPVPDRLGNYLITKYPQSFVLIEESKLVEKNIVRSNVHTLEPTKRFMIEPSLDCNIKCKFCYHLHRYDTWKDTIKPLDEMKKIIDDGIARGNNYMDITGGEPTIYPYILSLIGYAKSKRLRTCIITNGIVGKVKTEKLLEAGIDEFLVSRHGMEDTHNSITNTNDGYKKQCGFLNHIKGRVNLRFNVVINKFNENEIDTIAIALAEYKPKIVNFINMNPHHEWKEKTLETKDVIADLRKVESQLNKAIKYLESKDIGVNVRYYPMCRIAKKYRRCVCNDLHVMFALNDPNKKQDINCEWDYSVLPKTVERYFEWGQVTSNNNEEKGEPCCNCDLQNICGGINKYFHKASNEIYGEVCKSQKILENISKIDYNYYRKMNVGIF